VAITSNSKHDFALHDFATPPVKIEYGATTLGDDADGDFILEFPARAHARQVQQEPLAFAANPFTKGRGNAANSISFTVSKHHADLAAAALFYITHPDALADNGILKFTEGGTVKQIADAALQTVEGVELSGASTRMKYTFTGGAIT
jgi:hypothetical protein